MAIVLSPHEVYCGAASTIDLQPKQQIEWIQMVEPITRNIGVLCSDRSERTDEAIRQAGQAKGLVITVIETTKDDFIEAVEELTTPQCDGVLIIPDAEIYNAASVRHLLLWGIRSKKAVWAFSEPAVKAGALAGLYPPVRPTLKDMITPPRHESTIGTRCSPIDDLHLSAHLHDVDAISSSMTRQSREWSTPRSARPSSDEERESRRLVIPACRTRVMRRG